MYSVSDLLRGIRSPHKVLRELHRRRTKGDFYEPGIDVFSREWDNLILLDACRYDYFAETADIDGDLSRVESRGSATPEWLIGNFQGKDLHDVVYVSANGWYEKIRTEIDTSVHEWIGVYTDDYRDEVGAVHPTTVNRAVREAIDEFPHKRLLIHYTQPHAPYFGPVGRQYWGNTRKTPIREMLRSVDDPDAQKREMLRKSYRENLEIVLNAVRSLSDELAGKTIITSDHGELLGDRRPAVPLRLFGHPRGVHLPELVEVPWLELSYETRRRTITEPPEQRDRSTDPATIRNLEELGYTV